MYTPFDLSGRAAVVTGGNGGIGYGMAQALLAAGAHVAIWGSRADKTERARGALAAGCGDAARVRAFVCDVGDEAQVEQCFEASIAALGPVDACFANAGVSGKGTALLDMSVDEFRRVQRVNVEGVFLTFRTAARHMVDHGRGGALVATASTAALEGAARNSHYGASKGAVTIMTKSAALAVGAKGYTIRVNSVHPGYVHTPLTEKEAADFGLSPDEYFAKVGAQHPIGFIGEPVDIAYLDVYLASDESRWVTGAEFTIDGGWTAQ